MKKIVLSLAAIALCASAAFALTLAPAEPPAVGSVAPEFTLTTNEGVDLLTFSLGELELFQTHLSSRLLAGLGDPNCGHPGISL